MEQAVKLYKAWRTNGDVEAYKQFLALGFEVMERVERDYNSELEQEIGEELMQKVMA